jgi:L-ribulose-5-phosphate 3-epimerase
MVIPLIDGFSVFLTKAIGALILMNPSRREFVAGAAKVAALAAMPVAKNTFAAAANASPFRLAVINDEISQDFEHACHVAAVDFGLQWIELRGMWGKNIADLTQDDIDRARKIVDKYHLRVTDIASPLFKTDFPGAQRSLKLPKQDEFGAAFTFEQQPEVLQRIVHLAKSFQTDRIRCFDFTRVEEPARYRAAMNEELRKAAATCGKNNLILLLENEMTCNTATGAEATAVLEAIPHPHFMLNWDAGNAAAAGETPYPNGYNPLPKNRIGHCHCKDVIRHPDGTFAWAPVGGGIVDWKGQLKALLRQNYHLGLSLETHWRGAGTAEASTRESMVGLKGELREVGALS